jgi:hypothetical protein
MGPLSEVMATLSPTWPAHAYCGQGSAVAAPAVIAVVPAAACFLVFR